MDWRSIPSAQGYLVYVGIGNGPLGEPIDIGYVQPNAAGEVTHTVRNLPLGPRVRFAIASYDATGAASPLSNIRAVRYSTAARYSDSDGDGLTDAEEDTNLNGTRDPGETDPRRADTDGDGLRDAAEIEIHGTNPLVPDTDNDGYTDAEELDAGTDPRSAGSNPFPTCGNAAIEPGEQCDDGVANSIAYPGACRENCELSDMCGDANGDRRLTATDATAILQAATGVRESCPLSQCDSNGDGQVSVSDSMAVLQAAFGATDALDCTVPVRFTLADSREFTTLTFWVDYAATGSSFVGEDLDVRCEGLGVSFGSAQVRNIVSMRQLYVRMDFSQNVAGPIELASCRFITRDLIPLEDDFVVYAGDSLGPDGITYPNIEIAI